jgi:hypothetical protein
MQFKGKLTILLVSLAVAVTVATGAAVADSHMDDGESMNETGPAITFDDQELDNGTVTVSVNNASLEEGGWVAVTYQDDSVAGDPATVVAGAAELGNETEVSVTVEDAGGFPGTHTAHVITELSQTSDIGTQISDITADNVLVNDDAEVVEEMEGTDGEEEAGTATVSFEEQDSDGQVVTVASVNLPEGGYVAIHDQTLVSEGDPIGSTIGATGYLEPGSHEEVTVELLEPIEEDQELIAMPHMDTNGNETLDFLSTEGSEDGPYVNEESQPVTDSAQVTVSDSMDDGMDDGEDMDGNESMDDGMDDGEDMDGNESMDDGGDEGGEDTEEEGGGEGLPGFTAIGAIVALLGAAFLMKDE